MRSNRAGIPGLTFACLRGKVIQGDSNSAAGVREGDILAGKYRVERVLGIGGMGVVVAAHHIHLDEKVALKFLLPEALGNTEAVARFAREARAAVKIKSEHVARVIDVGRLENGAPYMVMEYLEGTDLAAWLQERGVMPPEQAVEFVLQACEAIAEAHALGIVHRDLKPANLFCIRRADGRLSVKVLDFGISKITAARGGAKREVSTTRASALVGSPVYMSPEQMQRHLVSRDHPLRAPLGAASVRGGGGHRLSHQDRDGGSAAA
jgi:serine/threonine protein kinase